ncbi:hypothetical protein NEOLEDRAFT_1126012 [Neolentinus lepideus HHB14362 ss-1]|uniref:Mediator of RNA polymerase II transcription subunit 5 n=1 Tax=Neolentinus lepideus HHB14362 ss-1 TaxID=1314782 RepID=A0A165W034_9AGAM|nr:hypothetical protein NEOLEDRAFT_1126012 [Neolentinus lepideus HHB14362 ss-1]
MSLVELTRNSFQSGISAAKWANLVRLLISKEPSSSGMSNFGAEISNSVLLLLRSYPGDPMLQDYLKRAIEEKLIPVHTFISTFLSAAQSTELHNSATLDMLCRIALDAHYSSGLPPIGSVIPHNESSIVILGTVQEALGLLRTASNLPMSHYHQLTTSASELVILLLSCVTDMSQVSTAQAIMHFHDVNDMLQNIQLNPDVRRVLETFAVSLSLLIGDDQKAAREAQLMHALQLALGKDILGPNSDTDIVTCSLMFHYFMSCRGHEFGAGNTANVTAIFIRTLRSTTWTPQVFYTQLLLSAVTCLAQASSSGTEKRSAILWRAFVAARLPRVLAHFQSHDHTEGADWRSALQFALTSLFQRASLLAQCDNVNFNGFDTESEGMESSRLFARDFLQQLVAEGLLDSTFASNLDQGLLNDNFPKLVVEAEENGMNLEHYIESKVMAVVDDPSTNAFVEKVCQDPSCQAAFAEVIYRRFCTFAISLETEGLSHLCKVLYTHPIALDLVSLHCKMSDMVAHALVLFEDYDCETVGDPQTAVSHLGDVVLFLHSAVAQFQINGHQFKLKERVLRLDFLSALPIQQVHQLTKEEFHAFNAWFKTLFDSNGEGIEDTILRSTRPKVLLRLAPVLFLHAITVHTQNQMDKEVFSNGVFYFLGPLLHWTLVGVVKVLLIEIQQKGFQALAHLEALQTLLRSSTCPQPVLRLCSPNILRLFATPLARNAAKAADIDLEAIIQLATFAIGPLGRTPTQGHTDLNRALPWVDQSRSVIRECLTVARNGKAPALDIDRCLLILPPVKFLHLLWSELLVAAYEGSIEVCRRVATYALTMPRSSNSPPLMPIFLHVVLPSLIISIDQQPPANQGMALELLVSVISYTLTASLHTEWALHTVCGDDRPVLGQSTAGMAKRLSNELRRKSSPTAEIVAHRLGSASSFVANFPMFVLDS